MPAKPLDRDDLAQVLTQAQSSFVALRDARILITGGTGFFGHWLVESLLYANDALLLNVQGTLLTRNAERFRQKSPHIANHPAITLLEGDAESFAFPSVPHTHIIHAATDSGGQQTSTTPEALSHSILNGTRRVLDFAVNTGAGRFLYTSTGAVYGRSTTLLHTPESYGEANSLSLPAYSYEEAKRNAESLCLSHPSVQPVIARCFAFVGPHLPLDQHFAIGNFIGAAIAGQPIHIKGDGTPRRSWLYMSDLAAWLWTMLVHGQSGRAYNVGSDDGRSIAEAAHLTASTLRPGLPVQIDGTPHPQAPLNSYVPDITRARSELGLKVTIPLSEALQRTAAWHIG